MSTPRPINPVRQLRQQRALSQLALAAAARISRQSLGAIEAGRTTPGVDVALRIAEALDAPVEDLFGSASPERRIQAEPCGEVPSGRVALAHIGARWVCYGLHGQSTLIAADAVVERARRSAVVVEPLRSERDCRETLVLAGCAGALGVLADRFNSRSGAGRCFWLSASSTSALDALARDQTHVAGVHLVDPTTGEANLADVQRHAGHSGPVLITLGTWEAGLVVAPGNPMKLRGAGDLGRRAVRLVSREIGSGARRLLDRELSRQGIRAKPRMRLEARGHLEVAQTVAIGAADAGVGTRDAAIAFGMGFVPLVEERYDLAVPSRALDDPRLQRLLDVMTSKPYRQELAALGYDVRHCGDRVQGSAP